MRIPMHLGHRFRFWSDSRTGNFGQRYDFGRTGFREHPDRVPIGVGQASDFGRTAFRRPSDSFLVALSGVVEKG